MPKQFSAVVGRSLEAFEDNERGLALYRALPDPADGVLRVEPWSFTADGPLDGFCVSFRCRRGDRVAGFREMVAAQQLRAGMPGLRDSIVHRVTGLIDEATTMVGEVA